MPDPAERAVGGVRGLPQCSEKNSRKTRKNIERHFQ